MRPRTGLAAPIRWIAGNLDSNLWRLISDGDKGLFSFTPVLAAAIIGLVVMWRRERRFCLLILSCAVPWFALHVSYEYMMLGDSYSTRYLVPIVPLVMLGIPWFEDLANTRPHTRLWRVLFAGILAWSVACNAIAGIFPATSFSHTPIEMFVSLAKIARALLLG
jgi:hypothetical protein